MSEETQFDEVFDTQLDVKANPSGAWRAIQSQHAEITRLRTELEWYGEQARLCRLIHSEGDKGRHALSADGGNRARAALGNDRGVSDA